MAEDTSTNKGFWKNEINLGQLLGILITLFGAFGTAWWDVNQRVNQNTMKIGSLEKTQEGFNILYKEGQAKQDIQNTKTNEKLEQILIQLVNKKDRE